MREIKPRKELGIKMEDFINEIYFEGVKEGIRLMKGVIKDSIDEVMNDPCSNKNPEDMCDDCDCWKHFRKSCS